MVSTSIITTLYYVMVVISVGISTYLSYGGFKSSFGGLSLAFVAILAIMLFSADLLIQKNRVAKRSLLPPFLLFGLAAFFSGISNYNYLYTMFMENDVIEQTLSKELDHFRSSLTDTRTKLQKLDSYIMIESKRIELDRELARLDTQIFDDLRPGCGERCREHLRNIEGILGKPLTDLALPGPGSNKQVMEKFIDRVRTFALTDLKQLSQSAQVPEIDQLIKDIDKLLLEFDATQSLIAERMGLSTLQVLSKESKNIERRANSFLPNKDNVTHAEIDPTLGRLGEIVYSLENGFISRPNLGATIMALILGLIVDLFPVIFALIAFGPETGIQPGKPTRPGRAGIVLD